MAEKQRIFTIGPQERLKFALEIAGHFSEIGFVQDTLDTLAAARELDDKTHDDEMRRLEMRAYRNGIENVLGWPSKYGKAKGEDNRLFAIGMLYVAQDYAGRLGLKPGDPSWPSMVRAKAYKNFVLIDDVAADEFIEEGRPRRLEYFFEAKQNYVNDGWITATQGAVKVLEKMEVPKAETAHWLHNAKVKNYMDKIVTAMSEARRHLAGKQMEEAKRQYVRAQILTNAISEETPA